jgi:hypothetical protein
MNSLFPGRDQEAGTDAAFDAMLKSALERSEGAPVAQPRHASLDDRIIRGVQRRAPPEKTPLPPLLKVYWVLIALLLLLVLAALSNRRQQTSSSRTSDSPTERQQLEPTPALFRPTPASTPSSVTGISNSAGRYLKIGPAEAWMGIDHENWSRYGISPLWVWSRSPLVAGSPEVMGPAATVRAGWPRYDPAYGSAKCYAGDCLRGSPKAA